MENCILVGLRLPGTDKNELVSSLAELSRLTETAGGRAVETVIQSRHKTDSAYLIGRGKAEELKEKAAQKNIHTIIFDEELKPVQQKNLEELLDTKVIDRTRLILDIFAKRARSREGMLQVERAQLAYYLPRITERFGRFEQQTGGVGTSGGIGAKGPGERKLEVDQRKIRDRLAQLDREIESIGLHRGLMRKKRAGSGQSIVAIAGYTNAGKSTLLNAISHSHKVYADDLLFATLDPTTRRVRLPAGRTILVTDTVGFIKKLPHTLVAAFRATLEEVKQANCLLHVIDASHEDYGAQAQTVLEVLKELGADKIPVISVYNKCDLLTRPQKARISRGKGLLVSAATGYNLDELLRRVEDVIMPKMRAHKITLPYGKIGNISEIFRLSAVKKQDYTGKGINLKIECIDSRWEILKKLID